MVRNESLILESSWLIKIKTLHMGKPTNSLSHRSWICLKVCMIGEGVRKRASSYTFHVDARVQVSSLPIAGRPGPLSR